MVTDISSWWRYLVVLTAWWPISRRGDRYLVVGTNISSRWPNNSSSSRWQVSCRGYSYLVVVTWYLVVGLYLHKLCKGRYEWYVDLIEYLSRGRPDIHHWTFVVNFVILWTWVFTTHFMFFFLFIRPTFFTFCPIAVLTVSLHLNSSTPRHQSTFL